MNWTCKVRNFFLLLTIFTTSQLRTGTNSVKGKDIIWSKNRCSGENFKLLWATL